jgi:hypothetical protein
MSEAEIVATEHGDVRFPEVGFHVGVLLPGEPARRTGSSARATAPAS